MFDISSCPAGQPLAARSVCRNICLAAILAGTGLLTGCGPTPEQEQDTVENVAGEIAVADGWSRETAPGQEVGGAFLTITNAGDAADTLIGGSSPAAREVQIHTVDMADGIMRMRELEDGLEIPAGKAVTLKPGSYHIMLMGLGEPLERGTTVPLKLQFKKAGSVDLDLAVLPIGSEGPGEHSHD